VSSGLQGTVVVGDDESAVAMAAAEWIASRCDSGRTRPDAFRIALTGGSTPRRLYELLATPSWRDRLDWPSWRVYFSDERACPPEDARSNYKVVADMLLSRVPIDPGRVDRMRGEASDLEAAAAEYSQIMAATCPPGPAGAPRLDCLLLGVGENGHVASLFPGTTALEITDAWATTGVADYEPYQRITLTLPAINASAAIALLVVGAAKGEALRATATGASVAARVRPVDGEVRWFLDRAAASELR
jgi:6-phosphogluconolactonase